MKKNLFLSICSLLVTTFLLFFLVFGWYVSNTEVSANGIFGTTAGDDYEVTLERANIDANGSITSWSETSNIVLDNIKPSDAFIFRLTIKSKSAESINLTLTLDEIESSLVENRLLIKNDSIYEAKGDIPIYSFINDQVIVEEIADSPIEKILYKRVNGSIELADYKIEDAFKLYDLKTNEPVNSTLPTKTGVNLSNGVGFNVVALAAPTSYYFALEFNEELSNKNINGIVSSNMYLYQSLKIGRISLLRN